MARLLVLVNSVVLLLFGSDMFLVGASKYKSEQLLCTLWPCKMCHNHNLSEFNEAFNVF